MRPDSNHVGITIHWHGGFTSEQEAVRPVRSYEQLDDFEALMSRIEQLRADGHGAAAIADKLNEEGFSPPKRCGPFFAELVRKLLSRRGLANEKTYTDQLTPQEWWLADLGRKLDIDVLKLRDWILRGWLQGRQTPAQGLWIAWADGDELKRLRKLKTRSARGVVSYPEELTTPKKRPTK